MAISAAELKRQLLEEQDKSKVSKAGRGLFRFAKGIAKEAATDLVVKPLTKTYQAVRGASGVVRERGVSEASAKISEQNLNLAMQLKNTSDPAQKARIKRLIEDNTKQINSLNKEIEPTTQKLDRLLGDREVNLGKLGRYGVSAQQTGVKGYLQAGGQGLKAASWLYTPGAAKAALAAKPVLKTAVKAGAKAGAKMGAVYGAGESLQQKDLTAGKFIKDVGTSTVTGAAGGAVLSAAGYGASKAIKGAKETSKVIKASKAKIANLQTEWQRIQDAKLKTTNKVAVKGYEKAQAKIEQEVAKLESVGQGGFIKNPFIDDTPTPKASKAKQTLPKQTLQSGVTQSQTGSVGGKSSSYDQSINDISKFYNVDRLNIDDKAKAEIKGEIEKQGKLLQKTVGKKLTNEEVLNTAAATNRVITKAVSREETKAYISTSLKLRQEIARRAQDGQIDDEFVKLWITEKSQATNIARQLQARRVNADPAEKQSIDIILDSIYKVNQNADEIARVAKGVNFKDPEQVNQFYRQFVMARKEDWIDVLRYNSMLSSPRTHLINFSSNAQGTGIVAPIEKTVTGALDAMRSALTGKPREHLIGEGAAYAKGYYSNVGKASKKLWGIIRGKNPADYMQATELVGDINKAVPLTKSGTKGRVVENTLKFPSRLMEGVDQFFTALTEGGINSAQAYRTSKGVGKLGKEASEEASYRLFRGELGQSSQGHILNALDYLPRKILEARNSTEPVVRYMAKFTFPFVRTPINIIKQGVEYSPAGLSTLWGAANKTEQLSKAVIGTATATAVATLVGSDRLTFAEPTNEKQRNEFRAAGRQAYSVKVGNKWINYSKLHPAIAFNFALVAAVRDANDNKRISDDEAETVLQTAGKYMNFIADQSYLKSVGDFVAAGRGDVGALSRYIGNYPNQMIPFRAMMSYIANATDPKQRQLDPKGSAWEKQVQYLMMQIPGLRQKLPTRKGPMGQPIPNTDRALNAMSPVNFTTANEFYEANYKFKRNKRKFDKMKTDLKNMMKLDLP